MGFKPPRPTPAPMPPKKPLGEFECPKCKEKTSHQIDASPVCGWCSELFKKDIHLRPTFKRSGSQDHFLPVLAEFV